MTNCPVNSCESVQCNELKEKIEVSESLKSLVLFSSSSLDDAEDSKKDSKGVIKDDKQANKHQNKLPQVNPH